MSLFSKIKSFVLPSANESVLISIVLYFRRPVSLSRNEIHSAIVRAWGRAVSEDLKENIALLGPICFVNFDGMSLHLTNAANPYCPAKFLQQALAEFPEMRQQKVVREHKAFLTIDLMRPKNPAKDVKEACYRRMARLAAEFADNNCLGVYVPETGHLRPYDDDVIKALRSDQPLKEIEDWGTPPVTVIDDDDPRLQGAVVEARRRWPEFVQAFERRSPDQVFSVKAPFTDGDHTEWMWVIVSSLDRETVEGVLGNAPVDVRTVRENDAVTVRTAEIGDWVYQRGEELVGGFSLMESEH
jgi:uncharacterized protein YegJ (DUF2314 family)